MYREGGLNCVVKTVSQLSGMNIQFAAKVNFGGVIKITDAIGGVEVCIGNGGIHDPNTGIDWPAGPHVVQGIEALQFLRTRYGLRRRQRPRAASATSSSTCRDSHASS